MERGDRGSWPGPVGPEATPDDGELESVSVAGSAADAGRAELLSTSVVREIAPAPGNKPTGEIEGRERNRGDAGEISVKAVLKEDDLLKVQDVVEKIIAQNSGEDVE